MKFPFPTNGKVHVNYYSETYSRAPSKVSIPYERESSCEPDQLPEIVQKVKFPFPTNGKVHVNMNPYRKQSSNVG